MTTPTAELDIPRAIVDLAAKGKPFALAVVLAESGSTPRKAGTKAIIDAAGAIDGTIGGGLVEAEAQKRAVEAIAAGKPIVFDFAMEGPTVAGDSPICGGSMRILLDPTAASSADAFAQAENARRDRKGGLLLTTVQSAPPVNVAVRFLAADAIPDDLPFPGAEAIRAVFADGVPRAFTQEQGQAAGELCVLAEPFVPSPVLVIAGGGHIGQALARQAGLVGFDVLVLDDRPEFTDPDLYPPATRTRCGDVTESLAAMALGGDTYVAIVTRGHQHDRAALAACVASDAAYVGMIGSKRKVGLVRQDLLASGAATAEQLERVYSPIGLDIGAETVSEIATSIVAQLIAVRRRGEAPRMPTE